MENRSEIERRKPKGVCHADELSGTADLLVPAPADPHCEITDQAGHGESTSVGTHATEILAEREEYPDQDLIDLEETLGRTISKLWFEQRNHATLVKSSRAQLKTVRTQLAEQFYDYKRHLVKTGRNGGWAAFLRSQKIPLATADRYVERHRRSVEPAEVKLLTEDITGPTPEEVSATARKVLSKPDSLRTAESINQFLAELRGLLYAQVVQPTDASLEIEDSTSPQSDIPSFTGRAMPG